MRTVPHMTDDGALGDGAHLTCVLATTTRTGTPVAHPVSVRHDAPTGTLTVTVPPWSGPAHRADVRRDPRVALLFAGPSSPATPPLGTAAGSSAGSSHATEVLVQGEARLPDDVAATIARIGEHEPRPASPASRRRLGALPGPRRMADRARGLGLLLVVPTLVHRRAAVADRRGPAPPTQPAARPTSGPAGEASRAFWVASRRLAAVDSVVLAAHDGSGAPWLLRVRPVPHPPTGTFLIDVPPGESVRPGPASLLAHDAPDAHDAHDPHDAHDRPRPGRAVTGHLAQTGALWIFTPHGRIPGLDADPTRMLTGARAVGRAARRRLVPRPLLPPPVPGGELAFAFAECDVSHPS